MRDIRAVLAFCLLCGIWGTTWLAIKVVVREMPPLGALAIRFVLAWFALAFYARACGIPLRLEPPQWRVVACLALLMMAIPYALVFWGEQHVSSALTAILFATHPIFILLFAAVAARRNLFTRRKVVSLLLAGTGLLVIFGPTALAGTSEAKGQMAILGAAIVSALATVFAKHAAQGIHPVPGTTWQIAGALVLLVPVALWREGLPQFAYSLLSWLALVYLAVVGSCLAFVVYYWLLKRIAPIQISMIALITPVVASFAGWLVLGERLGARTIVGALLVLTGVLLILGEMEETVGSPETS